MEQTVEIDPNFVEGLPNFYVRFFKSFYRKFAKTQLKQCFKGLNYGFNSIWGCRAVFPLIFFRKRASQSKISFSGYFLVGGDGSLEVVDNQWQKNSRQIGPKRVFLR